MPCAFAYTRSTGPHDLRARGEPESHRVGRGRQSRAPGAPDRRHHRSSRDPAAAVSYLADLVRRLCEPAQFRLVASFAAVGGGRTSLADGVVHHHWRARPNCGRLACLVFGCSVAQSSLIPARHADRLWPMIPFMGTQGHGKAAKPAARLLRQAPGGTPTNRLKARLKAASDP